MKSWFLISIVCATVAMAGRSAGSAGPITFEEIPGSAPTDGMEIRTQFQQSHGVIFKLESGSNPRLAKVGAPITAFYGPPNDTGPDTPAAGQNVGTYFLTDNMSLGAPPSAMIIELVTPVSGISGVILDVDANQYGRESWAIEARDNNGQVIASSSIAYGDPNTGDGMATRWTVSSGSPSIYSVYFRYTGTKPRPQVGFAMDNLYTDTPAPLVGISNRAARDPIMDAAETRFRFLVWGEAAVIDSDTFTLDDGSGKPVKVVAAGHGRTSGEYLKAAGTLDNTTDPPTLTSSASDVQKLK